MICLIDSNLTAYSIHFCYTNVYIYIPVCSEDEKIQYTNNLNLC